MIATIGKKSISIRIFLQINYVSCLLILLNIFTFIPALANTTVSTSSSVLPYAVPDENGNATLNNTSPQLVITSPVQAITVLVEVGTTNPTINFNPLCVGGTATLPAISIISANAYNIRILIPASTTITGSVWDCILSAPTVTTINLPETSGAKTTLRKAIEVGFSGTMLSFDKPVRILFPSDKGKKVGYTRNSTSFTEILSLCGGDSGAGLGANEECKVDVGNDLVIWTRHFTKFATYSSVSTATDTTHTNTVTHNNTVTRTVAPAATPAPAAATIPEATHTTTITEPGVKLFDIVLTIENALLDKASDLVARTQFTSFGTVPTLVDMTYRIENAEGKEVFSEKGEVTVETEKIVTQEFKNLNIGNGKYTLVLTTTYGDSVKDEFKQAFEVRAVVQKSGTKAWIWIVSGLAIAGIAGFIVYLFIKRKEEEQ